MSDKEMTLKERFDWHMAEAQKHEAFFMTSASGRGEYNLQRAQLHATLAHAVAQRMTAENTEYLEGVVDQLHDLVELKYQSK